MRLWTEPSPPDGIVPAEVQPIPGVPEIVPATLICEALFEATRDRSKRRRYVEGLGGAWVRMARHRGELGFVCVGPLAMARKLGEAGYRVTYLGTHPEDIAPLDPVHGSRHVWHVPERRIGIEVVLTPETARKREQERLLRQDYERRRQLGWLTPEERAAEQQTRELSSLVERAIAESYPRLRLVTEEDEG